MRLKPLLLAGALAAAGPLTTAALLPTLTGPWIGAAQAQGAVSAGDAIAERKAGLKRMAAHMEAIKGIVDGGGAVAPVAERAQDMTRFFEGFPALFPPGSDQGETRARPEVWSDRAGFEKAAANMVLATRKLGEAAGSGDAAAVAAAFRETGGTCGACHRSYRAR
ncbi:c-type cytochrome [Pseudoroseomonas sp. WGS1072]|uniref:c-type cytochrome n=1 Tax=Roseomonas sp. WGS1072 TaxID=3366816 RepID=UPI003BF36757